MLTSLEIENFKGIAARQRVDFAPLTLLFGANSAGKSSILQALIYLHELIERGSADVDRTELGGQVLELGGFARLVHQHDTSRSIVLRAEFTTPGQLERFGRDLTDFPFPDLDDEVESAWLELTIAFKTVAAFRGATIERVVVGVNGDPAPLVTLELGPTMRPHEPVFAQINLGHALIADAVDEITAHSWDSIAFNGSLGNGDLASGPESALSTPGRMFALRRRREGALPHPAEPLHVIEFGELDEFRAQLERLENGAPQNSHAQEMTRGIVRERERAVEQVRTFLEMTVLGTTAQLVDFLRDTPYVGPLRAIPPRGFLYERAGRITSWADGLAAWELLLADRETLVERTNRWLSKLNVGCQIVVQQLFEGNADAEDIGAGHVDRTVRRLLLDTGARSFVLPSEVGAGISQLVPVVVAAVQGRGGLSLIEQPEIHVHPAVQVGLGDLCIEATTGEGGKRSFVVETHSEHLILRLLRRIRETTDKELVGGAPAFNADQLSVLYVEGGPGGVRVRRLRVDERGEFVDRWPKGFFAERMEELL